MPLPASTRLGRYEVVGLLGAGGMGEVYRARDTELSRMVAVKILPGVAANAPERVDRFIREAQATAALNHPNILAVYDVGADRVGPFIVSELLEGQTLHDARPPGHPWPVRRVLELAVQVGRGVAAAHARGIVHRDLTPQNIFVTDDGVAKILDFGLARLIESAATRDDQDTAPLTRERTVLGTMGYMAPEQVRGQPADHRADLFAFGAIVYELLAGRRAFAGDSSADVATAILTEDPADVTELQPAVPAGLARIVSRCLEKRPEARFQSASDLVFALEALSSPSGSTAPPAAQRDRTHRRGIALAALASLAFATAVAFGFLWGSRAAPLASPDALPAGPQVTRLTELAGLEEFPALSPDGRSVAFTASVAGRRQVFVRLIGGGTLLQLTSAPVDHQLPRWSPDSSSLVYFSPAAPGDTQGAIWEVPAFGGAPRRISDSLGGADVSPDDGRIACFRLGDGAIELATSPRDGSAFTVVARLPIGSYYWYPRWSPDAKWIAFQRGDGVRFDVFAVPASGGEPRQVTSDNTLLAGLAWLPDGSGIVYSSGRGSTVPYLPVLNLWEARLDAGAPRQLTSEEVSYTHPDIHKDGAVVVSRMLRAFDIWRFPVSGSAADNARRGIRVTRQTGHVQTPTTSPDGREVAYLSDSGGHANLWVIESASTGLRQITHERDADVAVGVPIWSPDGRSIAFVSSRGNPGYAFGIWLVNPDGGNLRNLVPRGLGAAWSADGRWLYYVERPNDALRKLAADGGEPVVVRSEKVRNGIGSDGSTLYFLVERALVDGTPEYQIRAAMPEDGPSRLVARVPASRLAGWQIQIVNPALSPDGKWLAQALIDGMATNIWVVSTSSGEWRQITDFGDGVTFIARRVSWSADGQSILAAVGEGDADIVLIDGLIAAAGR